MKILKIRDRHLKAMLAEQKLYLDRLNGLAESPSVALAIDECLASIKETQAQLTELHSRMRD